MAAENRLLAVVEEFKSVTGYDLRHFLLRFSDFESLDYPKITAYFNGSGNINNDAFNELSWLSRNINVILDIIDNQSWMGTQLHWELVDKIGEIHSFLMTANNSDKWQRSTISNGQASPAIDVRRSLSNNELIEDVELIDLGSTSHQDTWTSTAIRNDFSEEDIQQGRVLSVTLTGSINTFDINSIVDNPSGKNIYGKDIAKRFSFSNNDLEYLGYEDTMNQTVGILLGMTKGSNFFSPQDGINKSQHIGVARASISYPSIFRQMAETLATDDSISSFSIIDITRDQNAIFFGVEVTTRLGEFLKQNIEITG